MNRKVWSKMEEDQVSKCQNKLDTHKTMPPDRMYLILQRELADISQPTSQRFPLFQCLRQFWFRAQSTEHLGSFISWQQGPAILPDCLLH